MLNASQKAYKKSLKCYRFLQPAFPPVNISNQQQKSENNFKVEAIGLYLIKSLTFKQTKVCKSGPWSSIFSPTISFAGLETMMCTSLKREFKGIRFSAPKMGSFHVALVTAALALTETGYGEQLTFRSHRLHHPALLKVSNALIWSVPAVPHCSKGSAFSWASLWPCHLGGDISSSSSSLGEQAPHAAGATHRHMGSDPERERWEGADEINCACPQFNTNTATLHSQHTQQKYLFFLRIYFCTAFLH